jgi:nicotinamidase-related amidase
LQRALLRDIVDLLTGRSGHSARALCYARTLACLLQSGRRTAGIHITRSRRTEDSSEHEDVLAIIHRKNQAPLPLDPQRTALLVIDVQRYFVRPEYPFGQVFERLVPGVTAGYFERVQKSVTPNIRRLLKAFRSRGGSIFYTATGTRMGYGRDLPGWLRDLDQLGLAVLGTRIWPSVEDPSWQVDDSVAPLAGEPVLIKTSSGPFASTRLDQTLRHLGIDSVVVTGLTTDVCVTQTAREMADRGFTTVIVTDACTTLSEEMHRGALQAFNIAFGRVRTTDELLELLATSSIPAEAAVHTAFAPEGERAVL